MSLQESTEGKREQRSRGVFWVALMKRFWSQHSASPRAFDLSSPKTEVCSKGDKKRVTSEANFQNSVF